MEYSEIYPSLQRVKVYAYKREPLEILSSPKVFASYPHPISQQ